MTTYNPEPVKQSDAPRARLGGLGRVPARRRTRGIALIEFAFVFPFLLILFFSIIDFGIYFLDQHTLQFATREGARVGLVGRQLTGGNGVPMSREASIITTIQQYAAIAINPANVAISIYPINADLTDPVGWKGLQDAGSPGAIMRVRVQYNYKFITPFVGQVMNNGALMIQAEATYKNESF
jgi:hypothetical protein